MIIRKQGELGPGYTPITAVDGAGREARMDFGILRMQEGQSYSGSTAPGRRERVYLLLHGAVRFRWSEGEERAERGSMLEESPTALHLPGGAELTIQALAPHTELAVVGTDNEAGFAPRFIPAGDIKVGAISVPGLEGTADRVLRTACDDDSAPDSNLAVGEVINMPGRWSSYPPHHHPHPEIYHYRFFPPGGFGYCGHGREVFRVHDGDTAVIRPSAPHPQVAAPGYTMIYLWAIRHLEGDRFRGDSRIYETEHTWVLEAG